MLRGEAIAWIFGLVMLETVRELDEGLAVKSRETMLKGRTERRMCRRRR
jgi:pantothenate synthetase